MRDREFREDENREDPLTKMGYETQDIDYSKIGKAATAFFGFFFICIIVAAGFYALFTPYGWGGATNTGDKANRIPGTPVPLLQSNITTRTDIMTLRQEETRRLNSYAAVDQSKGIYRIPVDRAIDLLAERGLPKTTSPVPTTGMSGAPARAEVAQQGRELSTTRAGGAPNGR